MDFYPVAIEKLIEEFAKLPGIGYKTAQRLRASHSLHLSYGPGNAVARHQTGASINDTLRPGTTGTGTSPGNAPFRP